jgi:hypothetical protein
MTDVSKVKMLQIKPAVNKAASKPLAALMVGMDASGLGNDQSRKESSLSLGKFDGSRALRVVISDIVDTSADRVTPHLPSIVWLQHLRYRFDIGHPRIEPQVVVVWIKDDWHPVMDGRSDRIRCRRQD